MKHVSHFNQKMAVHANNEALMCKVFPSSLRSVVMHWFDALEEGSVGSFKELIKAFGARFIICCRVPKPIEYLLFMAMREGETLKTYSDRYWETYNKIDGNFEHELRKSLMIKSVLNMHQLMDHIDKYKRVEEH